MPAIIVFSHLRWNAVHQRPRHLMSSLSKHYPVVFIEEPVPDSGDDWWEVEHPDPGVIVCRLHAASGMSGFHAVHQPGLRKMVRSLIADYDDHIAWLYTPMALPLLQEMQPRLVVYDRVDDLAAGNDATQELTQHEDALLKTADLVFTNAASQYRIMRERHPDVHCFVSSVDPAGFALALDRANSHPLHRQLSGPRMGYYGVIDERLDLDLLGRVADAHPQWQLVMVGPVLRIAAERLPRRPNVHYLGPQPYDALPQFLAGWDVCLLPFAVSDSTRHIDPARALEYMAAELPVVSTPVSDVADHYGDVVTIAGTPEQFVAACESVLLESPAERSRKVRHMRQVLAKNSWDATAAQMHALMLRAQASNKPVLRLLRESQQQPGDIPAAPDTRRVAAFRR